MKECIKRILPIMAEILEDELKTKQKRIWTRKWILHLQFVYMRFHAFVYFYTAVIWNSINIHVFYILE